MKRFIAIDGGGSKTEMIYFGEDMKIIKHVRTGATNFNEKPDAAAQSLSKAVNGLKADAVYAGIAGAINCHDAVADVFSREGFSCVRVESDIMNVTSAELGEDDGCAVICGTGSSCFAKRGDEYKLIGGRGYLLDMGGSGFDIGRDGINTVICYIDGRGNDTLIKSLFETKYKCLPDDMLTEIYSGGKSMIAGFSSLVFEAAAAGDGIAVGIIERNMSVLADYIKAAAIFIGSERFRAVLTGGILEHNEYARNVLSKLVLPEVTLQMALLPQIICAAINARKMLGYSTSVEQIKILLEEYNVRT